MNQAYYAGENAVVEQYILSHGSFYIILLYIALFRPVPLMEVICICMKCRRKILFYKCSIDLSVVLSNGMNFACV